MQPNVQDYCEKCGRPLLADGSVMLELDQRTNTFTDAGVPAEYSQGWFPFGVVCARLEKRKHADRKSK